MRIWHVKLLPYLPDRQLKGQLRELVAIMRTWRDKGKTNHLLINAAMCFDKAELAAYFNEFCAAYEQRFGSSVNEEICKEFTEFAKGRSRADWQPVFYGWHDRKYLRICMANLYEKYYFGRGISRVTPAEWSRLEIGYEEITGEDYSL